MNEQSADTEEAGRATGAMSFVSVSHQDSSHAVLLLRSTQAITIQLLIIPVILGIHFGSYEISRTNVSAAINNYPRRDEGY